MFPKELAADPLVFCYPQGRASCQTRQRPVLMYEGRGGGWDAVTGMEQMAHRFNLNSITNGPPRSGAQT